MLAGKWTYRSFRNDAKLVGGDAEAALALIFGEGVFDFDPQESGRFRGGLGMSPGYALTLTGEVERETGGQQRFSISGEGIAGTATEGWRYDYRGVFGYLWPDAVDQVPSLLGTVVRAVAHGPGVPAGYSASFIAVRQKDEDRPRLLRVSTLTAGL